MKGRKRYLLLGLFFGVPIGWTFGFLRLPYLERNFSFLLGFIAALMVISLALIVLVAWNRNFLLQLIGKNPHTGSRNTTRTHILIWLSIVGIILAGGATGGLMIYKRQKSFNLEAQKQKEQMNEIQSLLDYAQQGNISKLIGNTLDAVSNELKRNPKGPLSDSTIATIQALSNLNLPYKITRGGMLPQAWSAERGQLLQALVFLKLDSSSFARIKATANFEGADLHGADLKGLDFSKANLKGANLRDADLSGANLTDTDLSEANLWGAKFNHATMYNINLHGADLRWAQLNDANLERANLNGVLLENAQLRNAYLHNATFQWTQSSGALLMEANLTGANLTGSTFTKANLKNANLRNSDLRRINLSEANLASTDLNKAAVDEDWSKKIKDWRLTGLKEVEENYSVVNDSTDKWKKPVYRLKKN